MDGEDDLPPVQCNFDNGVSDKVVLFFLQVFMIKYYNKKKLIKRLLFFQERNLIDLYKKFSQKYFCLSRSGI